MANKKNTGSNHSTRTDDAEKQQEHADSTSSFPHIIKAYNNTESAVDAHVKAWEAAQMWKERSYQEENAHQGSPQPTQQENTSNQEETEHDKDSKSPGQQ